MGHDIPRTADLNRGILPTEIPRGLAWVMTLGFLALIFLLPVAQAVVEWRSQHHVQALELFAHWPTKDHLHGYEKDLERHSLAKQLVQPSLQLALSQHLGFGNKDVTLGREGWLFYRPGVDFLTGPGFLEDHQLRWRRKELADAGEKNPCPDPRPAILAFHRDCLQAGVHLVLVPVPDKAMLQPAELTTRLAFQGPIPVPANPHFTRFLEELRQAGVDVFDPTPAQLFPGEPARFLRQDTHWTPAWMEEVARDLAEHIQARVSLPSPGARGFQTQETQVSRVGDLVDMLRLPAGQHLFLPQTVTIRRVLSPDGKTPWQSCPQGDVLLLGDSFSNIYGAQDMGWGDAACFPAQVARCLGREVEVLARNGSGATATRRELARRPAPLDGKRVVIWEFAVRDLALASWEVTPLFGPAPGEEEPSPQPSELPPLLMEGTVVAVSQVPQPFTVPYKDCLTYLKLHVDQVIEGTYREGYMIAVLWGMRDNVLQPAAHYAPGKKVQLKVVPLRQAPVSLQTVRTADDLDDYDHLPYFALEEKGL